MSRTAINLTPLMLAAQNGDEATVARLVTRGDDVNAINPQKHSALFLAADKGHKGIVNFLIAHDAKQLGTSLVKAAENGHGEVVNGIVTTAAVFEKQIAAHHLNNALVKELLSDETRAFLAQKQNKEIAETPPKSALKPQNFDAALEDTTRLASSSSQTSITKSASAERRPAPRTRLQTSGDKHPKAFMMVTGQGSQQNLETRK